MQKRKRTTHKASQAPKRRRRTMHTSAPRRRRRTAKKGMLSELFNPVMAEAAAKSTLSGIIGGAGAGLALKIIPETVSPTMKAVYLIGGGFGLATLLKMPNLGAGMAGVGAYELLKGSGMLAEDSNEYDYANPIENLPIVMNEGEAQYLSEAYLSEAYLSEDYLSEDDYQGVLNYDAFNY